MTFDKLLENTKILGIANVDSIQIALQGQSLIFDSVFP